MTLDLDELTEGWNTPAGELRARVVPGRDGGEFIQIRLDLGVMQFRLAGRPDGGEYHGFHNALEYCEHEIRAAREISRSDFQELDRELQQFNYRRVAYGHLAEDSLRANRDDATERYLTSALNDIDACQARLRLLARLNRAPAEAENLRPALAFDQARLLTQWRLVEGQFEDAVEQAEQGAAMLELLLTELGFEEMAIEEDSGVRFLRDLGRKLRTEYGITQTLREQLEEALDAEDFEAAARIRDAMKQRELKSHAKTTPPSEQ